MKRHVGRRQGTTLEHAFDIESTEGGGIRITGIKSLSDLERQLVYAHFGQPIVTRVARGESEFHMREFRPGSADFFRYAVQYLPEPFALMARP